MKRTIVPGQVLTASAPVSAITVPARITAADVGTRKLTGRILQYGVEGQTAFGRVRFNAGAIQKDADLSGIKLLVEHDSERVIGYAETVETVGTDIMATFYVAPGEMGDEVLASAAGKLRDGLSVGVSIIDGEMKDDGVYEISAGALRETSVVAVPAFSQARVTEVAASAAPAVVHVHTGAPAAPAAPAAGVLTLGPPPGPANFTGAGAAGGASTSHTLQQTCGLLAAAYSRGGMDGMVRAALTDIIPPATGTDTYDKMPGFLTELWTAVRVRRQFIDAFGPSKPLTTLKQGGFKRNRPALGVDDYAGNKAEIPSPGTFGLEWEDSRAKRIAGGHDIDRAFEDLDFGEASVIEAYFEIQAENYAILSEQRFQEFAADNAGIALPATSAIRAITDAAVAFAQIGASTTVIGLATDVFLDVMDIPDKDKPWLFGGSANLNGEDGQIGDVHFGLMPALPAGGVLAADRRAVTHFEWKNPPLRVQAVNIPNGGIDVAVFGYWNALVNDPAAIRRYTVTAPVEPEPAV